MGSELDTKQSKYLAVLGIHSYNYSINLKFRSLHTIMSLLNDTKQYVCHRPSVIRSDDSFERRIAWSKSSINILLLFLYRRLWLASYVFGLCGWQVTTVTTNQQKPVTSSGLQTHINKSFTTSKHTMCCLKWRGHFGWCKICALFCSINGSKFPRTCQISVGC